MYGSDLDFSKEENQVNFVSGFIDAMYKDGGMAPLEILDFLKSAAEYSLENNFIDSKSAEDVMSIFAEVREKIANAWNPFTWKEDIGESAGKANADRLIERGQELISGIGTAVGGAINKGMEYIKDPEFLGKAAPWVIGGLGGYLIPKLFGGNQTAMSSLGGAALGAGVVGGGSMLLRKAFSGDNNAWDQYKQSKKINE